MERAEEERREAKDEAPGLQEGRGWPSTGVPQKSATGQDSRSPPLHPSNTGDEGERFRNGGYEQEPPLYAPLPSRAGNEKPLSCSHQEVASISYWKGCLTSRHQSPLCSQGPQPTPDYGHTITSDF